VETGPGSTLPALRQAVAATGARFEDIRQLAVTHIHLDHAGAAGTLMRLLPDARLFVHPLGARHMIELAKLLESAAASMVATWSACGAAWTPCPPTGSSPWPRATSSTAAAAPSA
jgi:glyoxylase-like metal-dependent hydrolase (beta-lactamase superfamily II)